MKKEIGHLDATPSKRLYLSIIADYDLNKSLCELIDNAFDVWVRNDRKEKVSVEVTLDKDQQYIRVQDNCGGIHYNNLRNIIGPGLTGNLPTDETIGIFGVGTKRAVVALSQDIRITTRQAKASTFQVDFDDKWLESDSWDLPVYQTEDILPNTTIIELQRLRFKIDDATIQSLNEHLGATYSRFLKRNDIAISVNHKTILPTTFDKWSYPPDYPPQHYHGILDTVDGKKVRIDVLAGLSRESSPATGEYGVYFYFNDRLVSRALKTIDVGFAKGLAGQPHPKVSLTRVIVSLNGEADAMPWNSSKSGLSTNHPVFLALRNWLVKVVKDYATLSRIWMGEWPEKVFKYKTGEIKEVRIDDFPTANKSFLPPFPKTRPRYSDTVTHLNRSIVKHKPWVLGLYEGIIAVDLIEKQRLEERNRIALILLDSTLEIAFKEYLVNDSGKFYNDSHLLAIFSKRHSVITEMKSLITLKDALWKKIGYYYNLRCKLVHERASVGISDRQIEDYRNVVERVLTKLYKLRFHLQE